MANLVGQDLGRYHIVEQLGEGGMAAVYKAYDNRLERFVAVKVILSSQQDSTSFLKRFERESKALAKLSHPNIVKVHDYGEERGIPYLVMEYIPGGTLKDRLGKPWSYQEAAHLLAPIARALEYAHSLDIVHRDIKPANILLTQSGQPMLSDFGIAKILGKGEHTELTGVGVGIGTPEYMAPEQGQGTYIDRRVDIYSLGIVFYELVTGRKPFQADTPLAVIVKQITEPLPRPKLFIPSLPDPVEGVIFKAVAKNVDFRFQEMGLFAQALEEMEKQPINSASFSSTGITTLQSNPTSGPSLGTPPQAARYSSAPTELSPYTPNAPYQQQPNYYQQPQTPPGSGSFQAPPHDKGNNSKILIAGGAVVAVLAILSIAIVALGMFYMQTKSTPGSAIASQKTPSEVAEKTSSAVQTRTPNKEATPTTKKDLPTVQPTQKQKSTSTPIPTQIKDAPLLMVYAVGPPGLSDIYIADEYGGNQKCLVCKKDFDQSEAGWSPDSEFIVFQANYNKSYDIYTIRRNGGAATPLFTTSNEDEREPDWSKDNNIAYRVSETGSNRDAISDMWMINYATKEKTKLGFRGRGPAWSPDGKIIAYMSNERGTWQIYTYNISTGDQKQVTSMDTNCRWPAWSPDGQYIAYNITDTKSSTTPSGILYVPANGGEPIIIYSNNQPGRPDWSPTQWIVFNSLSGIEEVQKNGTQWQPLIDEPQAWAPIWSK